MGEQGFVVGDRVRVKADTAPSTRRGEVATVGWVSSDTYLRLDFDDGDRLSYRPSEVERVAREATPSWTIEGVVPLIEDADRIRTAIDLVGESSIKVGDLSTDHPIDSLSDALDVLYRRIGQTVVESMEVSDANA